MSLRESSSSVDFPASQEFRPPFRTVIISIEKDPDTHIERRDCSSKRQTIVRSLRSGNRTNTMYTSQTLGSRGRILDSSPPASPPKHLVPPPAFLVTEAAGPDDEG